MNLRMEIADAEKLLQSLDDGAIDFAIVESFFDQGRYESLLFSNEPIVAVCGTGYEAPEEMTLSELMRYRIIIRERHAGALSSKTFPSCTRFHSCGAKAACIALYSHRYTTS